MSTETDFDQVAALKEKLASFAATAPPASNGSGSYSAEQLLTPGKARVSLPVKNKHLENLLMWRDPKASGAVFVGITLVYALLNLSGVSLLRLLLNIVVVLIVVGLLWANLGGVVNKPGPPIPRFVSEGFTSTEFANYAERIRPRVNVVLGFAARIFGGKEPVLSAKVAAGLAAVSYIALFVSPLTVAYIGVVLAFSLPRLYEEKKELVDQYGSKVVDYSKVAYQKLDDSVLKKIPKAKLPTPKQE